MVWARDADVLFKRGEVCVCVCEDSARQLNPAAAAR